MKKRKSKKPKKKPSLLMPGFDYGLENSLAIMTAPDFNENLRAANIIACAYGMKFSDEINAHIPIISLVATNPDLIKRAFVQFKSWIDATGPDALQVEILYSNEGYYISLGPNPRHLLWRTVGLDQAVDPLIWGLTYIKTIDTRNSFLDQLADQLPVAPVIVSGAHYTGPAQPNRTPNPNDMRSIPGCPELILFQLPIYKTPSDVPRKSGLISCTDRVPRRELANSREGYQEQAKSSDRVFARRERRIASLMPVTLHMLRTFTPLRDKVKTLAASGFVPWQLEQAIVNQRLWTQITPEARARMQDQKKLFGVISRFVELDSPNWQEIAANEEAILKQAQRDLRFLLRGLGLRRSHTVRDCQIALGTHGYLQPGHGS